MAEKKIRIVTSDGSYLYEIRDTSGKYYVYKVSGGFFSNDYQNVGEARNFDDALSIAKNHAPGSFKKFEFQ
jgi:hypothetical protein